MSHFGSRPESPLRVAIIGAGPAGFYTTDHLLKEKNLFVEVDMFDRLPTPFGLVRAGVAPDHQKIKKVTRVFDRIAQNPHVRYFGNVELGKHISVEDLHHYYHQIVYTVGTASARKLGIPGEALMHSHSATEFVGWLNGHPDYRHFQFDLSREHVTIIGMGNVALDVARMLTKTADELRKTDIANYALDALSHSRVREVRVLARRGPAQAACTIPELRELGELDATDIITLPQEMILDDASREMVDVDGQTRRKFNMLQSYSYEPNGSGKQRRIIFRFLVSPVEIIDDGSGGVGAMHLQKNSLTMRADGSLRPEPTDEFETIPSGLVFRSIGYRGVPINGLPFNQRYGILQNTVGRLETSDGKPRPGEYTAGWIKRGPSGIVGTNKPDALETVKRMMEDLRAGIHLSPVNPGIESATALVLARQPNYFTYPDWKKLDALETERGQAQGRPRVKFTSIEEMVAVVKG